MIYYNPIYTAWIQFYKNWKKDQKELYQTEQQLTQDGWIKSIFSFLYTFLDCCIFLIIIMKNEAQHLAQMRINTFTPCS